MTLFLTCLPFLISLVTGYFLISIILRKNDSLDPLVHILLAGGLGLAVNAMITFSGFIFFNHFNRIFILLLSIGLLAALFFFIYDPHMKEKIEINPFKNIDLKSGLLFLLLISCIFPVWRFAHAYPFGGWDAWSVWNLKAKFMFLAQDNWQNMFDPILWRNSPHYPLLLPSINVWGWVFFERPLSLVPLLTSIIFTFLTLGLLFASLKDLTKSNASILGSLCIITLPFFVQLATSQYCDIVFAFYLLAAFVCLIYTHRDESTSYSFLAGIFIGILSFTKSEGLVAALLLFALAVIYLKLNNKEHGPLLIKYLIVGAIIAFLPTILFKLIYSPGNQTFINGLISETKPSTLSRFKFIMIYLPAELISKKWNGIWIIMTVGLLFSWGRCFKRAISIVPLFLGSYFFTVLCYYFINTHFKIAWWLQVTMGRILFALLPAFVFWVIYSIWQDKSEGNIS